MTVHESKISRSEIESEASNCFSINLLIIQPKSSSQALRKRQDATVISLSRKGTLLRYSLSITEKIVSSVAKHEDDIRNRTPIDLY